MIDEIKELTDRIDKLNVTLNALIAAKEKYSLLLYEITNNKSLGWNEQQRMAYIKRQNKISIDFTFDLADIEGD